MVPAGLVAFPALLLATYGVFRVGRRAARPPAFEWVRSTVLAGLFAAVVLVNLRLAQVGHVQSAWALFGAVLSIAATFGLVGLNVLEVLEGDAVSRHRPRRA